MGAPLLTICIELVACVPHSASLTSTADALAPRYSDVSSRPVRAETADRTNALKLRRLGRSGGKAPARSCPSRAEPEVFGGDVSDVNTPVTLIERCCDALNRRFGASTFCSADRFALAHDPGLARVADLGGQCQTTSEIQTGRTSDRRNCWFAEHAVMLHHSVDWSLLSL